MSKIKINVYLEKNGQTIINKITQGIFNEFTITYQDNTLNKLNIKEKTLTRKTKEYIIHLNFKENKGKYKNSYMEIPINIKVLEQKIINGTFYIKYEQEILDDKNIYVYEVKIENNKLL